MPTKQTIATQKYQEKVGYISKAYKLKKELVEQFQKACEKNGVSQAATISEFMKQYVENSEV